MVGVYPLRGAWTVGSAAGGEEQVEIAGSYTLLDFFMHGTFITYRVWNAQGQ